MRVWVCGYLVYLVHLVRQGHESPYQPSKTLIWTEIDYLFYSTVLPNITYGLSVYGASDAVACAAGGIV